MGDKIVSEMLKFDILFHILLTWLSNMHDIYVCIDNFAVFTFLFYCTLKQLFESSIHLRFSMLLVWMPHLSNLVYC